MRINHTKTGVRLFFLDSLGEKYKLFSFANLTIEFDVDVSGLHCGSYGSISFVKMLEDGGKA